MPLTTRRSRPILSVALFLLVALTAAPAALASAGGDDRAAADRTRPRACDAPVVTGDIADAIVQHIDAEEAARGGSFHVPFQGRDLKLELVRVHVEYLSTLSPTLHFACVDMAGDDGQFYDIDFFLAGRRGDMKVTETSVHKLNGRPFYLWKQNAAGTWVRVPVAEGDTALQGVIHGTDSFEFRYRATLPEITGRARCWLPLASSDTFQTVTVRSVETPGTRRVLTDRVHGNRVLLLELGPEASGRTLEIVYDVVRREKSAYPGDPQEARRYLRPERMVPDDPVLRAEAEAAVAGRTSDLMKARALYDHVMDQMSYKKFGEGWGHGDALFACDSRYGNCTDYHAYFIGLARAVGIPARFAIGASIPSNRDDGGTDGYHCWAEFYADGKWWPVDISEADKFSALSMYYFGHHPANRFELSRGRDLMVDPGPAAGPINFLAYPVLEVDGQPRRVRTQFLFRRRADRGES